MNVLLGKGKLQLSGEMLSYTQLDHSLAGGTSWMANNELEMMCALLMRDGRYNSSVTIMPFGTMQNIEIAFQFFVTTIQVGLHRSNWPVIRSRSYKSFQKNISRILRRMTLEECSMRIVRWWMMGLWFCRHHSWSDSEEVWEFQKQNSGNQWEVNE